MTIWLKRYWFSILLLLNSLGLWIGSKDIQTALLIFNLLVGLLYFIMVVVFSYLRIFIERTSNPNRLFYQVYRDLASEYHVLKSLPFFKFITFFFEYLYAQGYYRSNDSVAASIIDSEYMYADKTVFSKKITTRPITFYHFVPSFFFPEKTLDVRVHRIHILHRPKIYPYAGLMEVFIHSNTYMKKALNPKLIVFYLTEAQLEELQIFSREAIEKDSNLYLRLKLFRPSLWRRILDYFKISSSKQLDYTTSSDLHFEYKKDTNIFATYYLVQNSFERILYPVYVPNQSFHAFSYKRKVQAFREKREMKPPRIHL